MTPWNYIKGLSKVIWQSILDFVEDKVLRMSAALAYYTIFSLGPILILVIGLLDTFYKKEAIEGKIYGQIAGFVGHDAALEIQQIIAKTAISGKSGLATVISIVVLVFSATGVFGEIQDSINTIWRLKARPKKGWVKMLVNRLLSFSMVVSLGFLLLVSLLINAVVNAISDRLALLMPELSIIVLYVFNLLLVFVITTLLFGIIFKVLPDAKIKWKHVFAGAITTALLFMLGKSGISFYLGRSTISSTYGAAGSIIVVLLWVYYSAAILYFGAEFTRNFSQWKGSRIYPNDYAVWVEKVEVESKAKLQPIAADIPKEEKPEPEKKEPGTPS